MPTTVKHLAMIQNMPQKIPVVYSASFKLPIFGKGVFHPPKNKVTPNMATKNIMAYSAKNMKAKRKPVYSVWKPPISSDSASGKSKGARLHSASEAMK